MGLAKEMWDYLKSIGFEDIPNDDYRLGAHADSWKNTIGYGNLCAYNDSMDDFIGFVDTTKKFNQNNPDLKIRSVADLEAWLRKEYPEFFTVEQHQYKVGDKVRILEDATNDNGDSVLEIYERTKTAVGEIGVVQKVHGDGLILVRGQCGGWWSYEPHQIEPYIEEFSMESSNEVEHHYIGIIPEKVTEAEEIVLKVGDVIQFNDGLSDCEIKSLDYVNNKINYVRFADITRFADINNGHIKSVNGKQGKFVIPPFDFKQTLLDDGFIQVITENYIRNNKGEILEILIKEDETRFHFWGIRDFYYECSPANAKRIINAAAELNELELA